jgi:hypothetical protein
VSAPAAAPRSVPARRRGLDGALGLALAVAFSPGLYDLARQWWLYPWSRYSAVLALLAVWTAARSPDAPARPRLGFGAVAAALLLQGLGVLAVMPALGRPAAVLAFLGFGLARGLAPLSVASLAIFVVPVPYQVTDWTGGDWVAPQLFQAAAGLLRVVGISVAAGQRHVISGDADFQIDSTQAGLPLAFALVGLAVYAALRLRLPPRRLAAWTAAIFAMGCAAHFGSIVLACLAIAAGSVELAGWSVDTLSWALPAALVVFAVERSPERRLPQRPSHPPPSHHLP